ncbi:MAG: hypothetical protein OXI56_02090 [bacterium]|nr:hypothetical protein [bacterium]
MPRPVWWVLAILLGMLLFSILPDIVRFADDEIGPWIRDRIFS